MSKVNFEHIRDYMKNSDFSNIKVSQREKNEIFGKLDGQSNKHPKNFSRFKEYLSVAVCLIVLIGAGSYSWDHLFRDNDFGQSNGETAIISNNENFTFDKDQVTIGGQGENWEGFVLPDEGNSSGMFMNSEDFSGKVKITVTNAESNKVIFSDTKKAQSGYLEITIEETPSLAAKTPLIVKFEWASNQETVTLR